MEYYYELWPRLRPEWSRFSQFVPSRGSSPSGFRPGASPLAGSACSGFEGYLDDRLLRVNQRPGLAELAEIRLIEPRSTRQIGDSLVRTENCGALHLVSLAAWARLRDRSQALDVMASIGEVTIDELDTVFETFGLAWQAEGPKEIVYQYADRPDCGEFRRPVNPSWDVMPRAMRNQVIRLLTCLQGRSGREAS